MYCNSLNGVQRSRGYDGYFHEEYGQMLKEDIHQLVNTLSPCEHAVIRLWFGLEQLTLVITCHMILTKIFFSGIILHRN